MTDNEIRELWLQANNRITELLLLVSVQQTFLQQAGLCTQADVDARVALFQKRFEERYRYHLEEEQAERVRERLRQLLENFEGTKQ